MFKMPKFLALLFFVEMWERFSYYGMRALLVLFLTEQLGFSDPKAYAIYSLFAALGYAGPVLGGFLADRFLGFRKMVTIGGSIMVVGHALLALELLWSPLLYLGLGAIAVGTSLFKGNITNLLGTCYRKDDPERDRGFTIFYISVNLGSFLSSGLCAWIAYSWGWHYGFGLAGVGMLIGQIIFVKFAPSILKDEGLPPQQSLFSRGLLRSPTTWVVALGAILSVVCAVMLMDSELYAKLLSVLGVFILAVLFKIWLKSTKKERQGLEVLFILMLFFTCFFALEMQLGSLINLFALRNVDMTVFGFTLPAATSQAINPLSIIILGPIVSRLFVRLGTRWSMRRYGFGLFTMSVCFFLLYLSTFAANSNFVVPYWYLFVAISMMGLGELMVAPLIQSYCTILSPPRVRGFMMGVLLLSISYSNLAGLLISKLVSISKPSNAFDASQSLLIYQQGFSDIMWLNCGLVVVFVIIYPFLNRKTQQALASNNN